MSTHIRQDVTDISSVNQLLRYAAAGQLQRLLNLGYTQERIALGAGLGTTPRSAGPVLATALGGHFTTKQLNGLDEIVHVLAPDLDRAGRLSSLALRLSAERRAENGEKQAARIRETVLAARIPPSWTRRMLNNPPVDETEVLTQASGLLSEFLTAGKMDQPAVIAGFRNRHDRAVRLLANRLMLISMGPPTWRNYDAQPLLGMLVSYAFDEVRDLLERRLRFSPLGFRVWRAVTMLVKLSEDGTQNQALRGWIRDLVRDSAVLRKDSLHAGSSYDLELALTVPAAWSPPKDDWVGEALRARARDPEATLRERGTAAMGMWHRAITDDRPDLQDVEKELRKLIADLRREEARPDAAAGAQWIAATLEYVIENRIPVCNSWPEINEPWYRHVQEAADTLDRTEIPAQLLDGTKNLFRHMILQNGGVYRRHAIETVVTSGMNRPVATALVSLLRTETQEAWLRVRVQAALGFMQRSDVSAQTDLTAACLGAYRNMSSAARGEAPPRSMRTEMHSSLFAVGDCFGAATGGEHAERGRGARDLLRPVLTGLAEAEGDHGLMLRRPARAAAYLLAITAQPQLGGRKDLSQELLERFTSHPDPVTRKLSNWMLSFRFAGDGTIRPLLAAAEDGTADDSPN
jgi:hypothetical protein